ncbi:MAG: transcription factor S [Methanosarcinales archaeon]|nr:transcription factor S [Methanosarcinales archaeon]
MQFCPKCKSMMMPQKGVVKCRRCGFEELKSSDANAYVSTSSSSARSVTVLEEDDIGVLPTANKKCPECGHNLAEWWMRQLRSADESETRFFRCTKCKQTWREYD